jgi:hypothetical protein
VRARVVGLAALAVILPGAASAQEAAPSAADRLALTGSLRAGYWWSDRELEDRNSFTPVSLWLKATPDLGSGFSIQAEGWAADEGPLRGKGPRGELREGFLAWRGDTVDLSIGRRIVAWGRADRINPTDVVGSRDYTLLFSDDSDQRRGSLMATASYLIGDLTLTALWLPEYRPTVFPIRKPPGFRVRQPDGRFDAGQFAVRIDQTGGKFDWSLSYFDGIDRDPDARIEAAGPSGVDVLIVHRRLRQFGADFATNVGDYGFRGELAYAWPSTGGERNAFERRAFAALVLGADRNLTEHVNVNAQYLLHYMTDDTDFAAIADPVERLVASRAALLNNQRRRMQQGATFRIAYTGLNDTLVAELAAGGYFTDKSGGVRPKATYALSDTVKVIVGADIFFGADDSYYGQIKTNSTGYAELRYSF